MATTKKTSSSTRTGKTVAPTAAKKTTTAKAAAKPAAAPQAANAGEIPNAMTKKALFERVKARSTGVKGREVRAVMDAVLDELGAAIVAGDGVKIQPFGTLKVQRRKPLAGGDIVVCKLRRKKPGQKAKDPLAEAAE